MQRILGERAGRDVFFYSISIDPARDTPEVLAEYARRYDAGPGWLFLTGKARDITLLRRKLGLYLNDIQDDPTDHNLSLVIGNQSTGQWKKSSPFENPYVLASELGGWLHNWKLPGEGHDYADAPALRPLGLGEMLFRTRCSACHVIGASDGLVRPGPNLLGVTERRDREWLARWLAAPDEMLAGGDPLAVELFETFKRVPMPNLRLERFEIEALLQHLEQESTRVLAELGDEPELDAPEGEPAPCCQKADFLVLDEAQDELAKSPTEEEASARGPRWRLTLPGWISVGSGVLLGLATLARGHLRRRG